MRKILCTLSIIAICLCANAQINKVQHFYLQTRDASVLFTLFNKTFGLPAIYDYQQFPGFSDGGLSLGNITFEFVGFTGADEGKAIFKGVAFEPKQHAEGIIPILDNLHIAHTPPDVATMNVNGEEKPFYTNIDLLNITFKQRHVFICDYADRNFITAGSTKAEAELKANNGGPLGVVGLAQIVISSTDKVKETALWTIIPGIKKLGDDLFGFDEGPAILLEQDNSDSIKEIIIKVRSKQKAADFLAQQKCLKMENGRLLIDPEKLGGLRIILEE